MGKKCLKISKLNILNKMGKNVILISNNGNLLEWFVIHEGMKIFVNEWFLTLTPTFAGFLAFVCILLVERNDPMAHNNSKF